MTIYVDTPRRRETMCHLMSDSLPELHRFAIKIKAHREGFQFSASGTPHYLIPLFRRRLAVKAGAFEINRRSVAKLCEWWRTQGD